MAQSAVRLESEREGYRNGMTVVDVWLAKIDKQWVGEEKWRKIAAEAIGVYEFSEDHDGGDFNLWHSNVETIVPAVYNSTPVPDARRRYGDKDPVARLGSEMIERGLNVVTDEYDFDEVMQGAVQDAVLPGRGQARVRYDATHSTYEGTQQIEDQEVWTETVPWDCYIQGPGRLWKDVPWVAFRHPDMTRDDVARLIDDIPEEYEDMDAFLDELGFGSSDDPEATVLDTVELFEIWCKRTRKVIWISKKFTDGPLKVSDDPLKLEEFFPVPQPLQHLKRTASLKPQCAYKVYKPLLEEIEKATKRIKKLIDQLKVRGVVDPAIKDVIHQLETAEDGVYVEGGNANQFTKNGTTLEQLIHHFPMDPTVKALRQLYEQRELAKQNLYEVSGLSDIIRGQSKASETATAQNIKSQWGSQRILRLTAETERFGRDLYRLKSEVILNLFEWDRLKEMTQMTFEESDAPAMGHNGGPEMENYEEEVRALFEDRRGRKFRIDVETHSTIQADFQRIQEQMNLFLNGTAQFMNAFAKVQEMAPDKAPAFLKIYATTFARQFNMGKESEDAIEQMSETQDQPDPQVQQLEQQIEELTSHIEELTTELQSKEADREHQMAMKRVDVEIQTKKYQVDREIEDRAKQRQHAIDQLAEERTQEKAIEERKHRNERLEMEKVKQDRDHAIAAAKVAIEAEGSKEAKKEAEKLLNEVMQVAKKGEPSISQTKAKIVRSVDAARGNQKDTINRKIAS